jgi:hypothetical protein
VHLVFVLHNQQQRINLAGGDDNAAITPRRGLRRIRLKQRQRDAEQRLQRLVHARLAILLLLVEGWHCV